MKTMNAEMDEAIIEIANANEKLASAAMRVAQARRDETECLNRVNAAQKRFDELAGMLRKQAPRDTDWKRERGVECAQ